MTITKKDYLDLKPYWDFQRKKEYNKEMINFMADKFQGIVYNDFGLLHLDEMKELLWTRVDEREYENPKQGYVPKDPKYRFEWETNPHLPTGLLPYDKNFKR